MIALLIGGTVVLCIGLLAVVFGIPIKEFSFGNTMILAGAVVSCTGLVLIGLYFVGREFRNLARRLETGVPAPVMLPREPAAEVPAIRPARTLPELPAVPRQVPPRPARGERPVHEDTLFTRDQPPDETPDRTISQQTMLTIGAAQQNRLRGMNIRSPATAIRRCPPNRSSRLPNRRRASGATSCFRRPGETRAANCRRAIRRRMKSRIGPPQRIFSAATLTPMHLIPSPTHGRRPAERGRTHARFKVPRFKTGGLHRRQPPLMRRRRLNLSASDFNCQGAPMRRR